MGKYECRSPGLISVPAVGNVEGAATGEHGTKFGPESAEVLGARPGHLERHGIRPPSVEFDVARVEVPVEHFGHAIVEVGDVAVERHGHDCDNLRQLRAPFGGSSKTSRPWLQSGMHRCVSYCARTVGEYGSSKRRRLTNHSSPLVARVSSSTQRA